MAFGYKQKHVPCAFVEERAYGIEVCLYPNVSFEVLMRCIPYCCIDRQIFHSMSGLGFGYVLIAFENLVLIYSCV